MAWRLVVVVVASFRAVTRRTRLLESPSQHACVRRRIARHVLVTPSIRLSFTHSRCPLASCASITTTLPPGQSTLALSRITSPAPSSRHSASQRHSSRMASASTRWVGSRVRRR